MRRDQRRADVQLSAGLRRFAVLGVGVPTVQVHFSVRRWNLCAHCDLQRLQPRGVVFVSKGKDTNIIVELRTTRRDGKHFSFKVDIFKIVCREYCSWERACSYYNNYVQTATSVDLK